MFEIRVLREIPGSAGGSNRRIEIIALSGAS